MVTEATCRVLGTRWLNWEGRAYRVVLGVFRGVTAFGPSSSSWLWPTWLQEDFPLSVLGLDTLKELAPGGRQGLHLQLGFCSSQCFAKEKFFFF